MRRTLLERLRRFTWRMSHEESGVGTTFSLFLMATLLMIGGYAVDVTNLIRERTLLQMTADSAAHQALVTREFGTVDESKAAALALAAANMPTAKFGAIFNASDITFGNWDETTRVFTASATSRNAVHIVAGLNSTRGNPVASFLLQMVGFDTWDVNVDVTYATYFPTCFREGFVGEGVVDVQSNNTFRNGFCVHSNDHVKLSSGNTFEPGTVVSMPNSNDIELPNSGFETNTGLADALVSGSYNIRILSRIDSIIADIDDPGSAYLPSYITSATTNTINQNKPATSDFQANKINYWNCTGGMKGSIANDAILQNMVIISNCEIAIGQGAALENVVLMTTNTSDTSISAPAGFRLGKKDNCAADGGAQIVTAGGFNVASKLEVYGSQILAKQDIAFAALASGIKGASMVAGDQVSGTSLMDMGFCGVGMERNFQAAYFHMVE